MRNGVDHFGVEVGDFIEVNGLYGRVSALHPSNSHIGNLREPGGRRHVFDPERAKVLSHCDSSLSLPIRHLLVHGGMSYHVGMTICGIKIAFISDESRIAESGLRVAYECLDERGRVIVRVDGCSATVERGEIAE